MAVWGQAPVSTASTLAGSINPLRFNRSASSLVTKSLVTIATWRLRLSNTGIRRSINAVLPDPTGPPTPIRAGLAAVCVSAVIEAYSAVSKAIFQRVRSGPTSHPRKPRTSAGLL